MSYKDDYSAVFIDEVNCKKMMLPYQSAVKIMIAQLESMDEEMKCNTSHSAIHSIKHRIKTPESIIEKLNRKNLPVSIDGFNQLYDIGGIRVICKYIDDIYYIRKLLLQHHDIVLVKESDYFKNPKENGYRSLHIIVSIPVYLENEMIKVPVEIQIRTIAMDMWASLEHQLRYKNPHNVSLDIYTQLKDCAETINETDEKMQEIYKKLQKI